PASAVLRRALSCASPDILSPLPAIQIGRSSHLPQCLDAQCWSSDCQGKAGNHDFAKALAGKRPVLTASGAFATMQHRFFNELFFRSCNRVEARLSRVTHPRARKLKEDERKG